MTPKQKKLLSVGFVLISLLFGVGVPWFLFFGGGYQAELWLARFDRAAWIENKMEKMQSPRRPMVKSLMRQLKPGMSRREVEELIGKPDYEHRGWHSYRIGYPRWQASLDYDVFEVYYEREQLVKMRVRNT
ncbi:MAG: outer membrane protein assembly factor BamE [Planctomycetes bacterium]|nr:outer membrane protein assembly factor BamE [Planctomycetota bacterium]MBU4399801.1 outer membrane protein assembly factor BamE [Planctomycetota bacterium]MCG2684672.1 outer membrane protein assembly factor BamE [Planctomycetales bacterium]